jgi:pentatricopeptide repeat protein
MIHGACKSGDTKMVKQLIKDMLVEGLAPDAVTYSMLINMYAKLGDLEEAERVLKQMTASGFVPDVAVFDSLIKGYSAEGQINKVLKLIHEMRAKNVALDPKIISTIIRLPQQTPLLWSATTASVPCSHQFCNQLHHPSLPSTTIK